jgi:hypothetical protein
MPSFKITLNNQKELSKINQQVVNEVLIRIFILRR